MPPIQPPVNTAPTNLSWSISGFRPNSTSGSCVERFSKPSWKASDAPPSTPAVAPLASRPRPSAPIAALPPFTPRATPPMGPMAVAPAPTIALSTGFIPRNSALNTARAAFAGMRSRRYLNCGDCSASSASENLSTASYKSLTDCVPASKPPTPAATPVAAAAVGAATEAPIIVAAIGNMFTSFARVAVPMLSQKSVSSGVLSSARR